MNPWTAEHAWQYLEWYAQVRDRPEPEYRADLDRFEAWLATVDPASGVAALGAALPRHRAELHPIARHRGFELLRRFLRSAGPAVLEQAAVPPELCDTLLRRDPLPDILPADLGSMSLQEIEARFVEYTGSSIAGIEARLRPGGASASGFLAEGERLAEVIRRDARTLAGLGVSRHELADRLRKVLGRRDLEEDLKRRGHRPIQRDEVPPEHWPLAERRNREEEQRLAEQRARFAYDGYEPGVVEVEVRATLGCQEDPFRLEDPGWSDVGGRDFTLRNTRNGAAVTGGDLTIEHIRRACFFEGSVPHRVDPEAAARVVGLLP